MPKKKTAYTITEAAKKLKISRQGVHKAINKGLLKARMGEVVQKVWLIPADSIDAYQVSVSHKERGKKN